MDLNLQLECYNLIKEVHINIGKVDKYKKKKLVHISKYFGKKSAILRNELFLKMKDDQIKWVKSILYKWKKFETEQEILSLSWDCFEFCFERYLNYDIPLPKHFYEYTRYHLLMKYGKKDRVFLPEEELQEILGLVQTPQNILMDRLLTLKQFREVIPDDLKVAWDDSFYSMSADPKGHMFTKQSGMDQRVYIRLKRAFIPIIRLILGMKE